MAKLHTPQDQDRPRMRRRQLFLDDESELEFLLGEGPPEPYHEEHARLPRLARALGKVLAVAAMAVLAVLFARSGVGDEQNQDDPLSQLGKPAQEPAGAPAPPSERRANGADSAETARTPAAPAREGVHANRARSTPTVKRATPPNAAPRAPSYAGVASALTELANIRQTARTRLARARTANGQSAAARKLEVAYGAAAQGVEQVRSDRFVGLSEALRTGQRAYAALAAAIAAGDQQEYDTQRQVVLDAEAEVEREASSVL